MATDLGFQLTARGTGRCRLPGHEDNRPSFSIRQRTNHFACFACGGGGDVIALVMAMCGLDFRKACEWLSDRYLGGSARGPARPRSSPAPRRPIIAAERPRRLATRSAGAPDAEVYGWVIDSSPLSAAGETYLHGRGFTGPTIRHFRIGQIGDRPLLLREAIRRFGLERLRACGLTANGRYGEHLVFPSGHLLFPFVVAGTVVYIQARRPDDLQDRRWLCLDRLLPPVFNLDALSDDTATISICEGVTDVVSAHELGFAAIGVLGSNGHMDDVTVDRLRGRNVAVFGDADKPGARFASGLVQRLGRHGITAIAKRLPVGVNDLNDHLRNLQELA